jgi:hypothetical protein
MASGEQRAAPAGSAGSSEYMHGEVLPEWGGAALRPVWVLSNYDGRRFVRLGRA